MKIIKLPDTNKEVLQRLLEKSIHTVEEFLLQTETDENLTLLSDEILTPDVLNALREKISQTEIIPDQTYPDTHSFCEPELKMSLLPLSGYLKKKTDEKGLDIKSFEEYNMSPETRRAFSEYAGITEKTANKLFVYVTLLKYYEEDRSDFEIEFTRSLFTKLKDVSDVDENRLLKLRDVSIDTIGDLEDVLGRGTETALLSEIGFSQSVLQNILKKAQTTEWPPETQEEIKKRFTMDYLLILSDMAGIDPKETEEIRKDAAFQTPDIFQKPLKIKLDQKEIPRRIPERIQKTDNVFFRELLELMTIPNMTPFDAKKLIQNGVHSAEDLAKIKIYENGVIQNIRFGMTTQRVIPYIIRAREIAGDEKGYDVEYDAEYEDSKSEKFGTEEIGEDGKVSLSEMLTQIGKGIGEAQRELDLTALEMQKEILKNRELEEYGLRPTWFAMPEIDFSLKMEYDVRRTETESGTLASKQVDVIPLNARYKSLYELSVEQESTLKIKFVPVPPTDAYVQRREVPDMVGMTADEAKAALAENNIRALFYTAIDLPATYVVGDERTEVTHQSVLSGTYLGIGEILFVLAEFRRGARAT
ncbi:MAG: PASTA domain-containing protein [Methanimicrococcus sp.]|nr:PASTA domain-containing protein [Methanimicrococcus sp.]